MSVLIKGMKMPEKCGSCDLFHVESPMHCTVVKGHKTVGAPYGMPRPDWCPLVEIPEPHGRLIDASHKVDMQFYDDEYEEYSMKTVTVEELLAMADNEVPTVIEAEGSEDE